MDVRVMPFHWLGGHFSQLHGGHVWQFELTLESLHWNRKRKNTSNNNNGGTPDGWMVRPVVQHRVLAKYPSPC